MSEYIVRERIELNFAQVPKTALKDKSLSLKAKGLYAYLFSLPEDWKVYKTEIVKHFSDGKDSLNSAFKELESNGYIQSKLIRDPKTNQFKGTSLNVLVDPLRISRSGESVNGKPVSGKPASTNNDNTDNTTTNTSLFNNKEDDGDCSVFFIKGFKEIRGGKFQLIGKAKTAFKARLKEGYSYKDILTALKNAMQDEYHIENNFNHLTPEFITRADKLEKYLNHKPKKKDDGFGLVISM